MWSLPFIEEQRSLRDEKTFKKTVKKVFVLFGFIFFKAFVFFRIGITFGIASTQALASFEAKLPKFSLPFSRGDDDFSLRCSLR